MARRPRRVRFWSGLLLRRAIPQRNDSTASDRLDPCNGLAACLSHGVAFDTGLLTAVAGIQIHVPGTLHP